jgi:hypothetical protein
VAISVPDLWGSHLACAVFAIGLAVDARRVAGWEARWGSRLYRGRQGKAKPVVYRSP